AEVFVPEGSRQRARGTASATLYAEGESTYPAKLRELSATADPATRTYRARYILSGGGETAPLGATVTLQLTPAQAQARTWVSVPLGALFDQGGGSAVWRYDAETQTVAAQPVTVARLSEESAEIASGLNPGDRIVALGAHLLKAGQKVRPASASMAEAGR
ncbi:efflux RND transporter periplasmic adaptor subunit, partial [Methylobacterium organophilum]|nr:efflux RND transporter periplasmic adaptor subunit [Methylobacterium organophilum]